MVFPDGKDTKHVPSTSDDSQASGLDVNINFSSKAAALATMQRSLQAAQAAEQNPDAKEQEQRKVSYDVVAAALRQRVFFYQVSLPHYQDKQFRMSGIDRCAHAGPCCNADCLRSFLTY